MAQLEELDGPFDVGEAAPAELEMGAWVGAARQSFGLHPCLHRPDLAHLRGIQPGCGIPQRVDQRGEGLPQAPVPGDRPGPQQRLELPGEGPPVVVDGIRGEAAGQGPVLALRTQIGVEDERIRPGRRHEPHEFLDDGQTLPMGGFVGHPGPGLVDDHDIGVGRVAQLAPAEASHPDDEHVHEQPVLAPTDDPGRDLQGGLDGRSGKVGESSPDLVRGELTGEIAEDDPQQFVPPQCPDRRHRLVGVVFTGSRAAQRDRQGLLTAWPQPVGVAEDRHRLGSADEEVGGIPAASEDVREPLGGTAFVAEHLEVPVD
ncbi:MAG: hypothetical protein BWY91_02422 [bacterium ADurb.BinA028]|nr:MAG: hypothetical protein BWY91_02422 [bacterium ADurb.BinA028]